VCKIWREIEERGERRGKKEATKKALDNLILNTGVSVEEALQLIGVPKADWKIYQPHIQNLA